MEVDHILSPADIEYLVSRGISSEEARRQVAILLQGVAPPVLDRPAVVDDGICRIPEETLDELLPGFLEAAGRGEVGFFVPASGAASRMFAGLRRYLDGTHPDPVAEEARLARLAQIPVVSRNLWKLGISPDDAAGVARALVEPPPVGYGWADRPKAFVPFHQDPEETFPLRTPLVEQVAEASEILGGEGKGTIHFTLPEDWPLPEGFNEACRQLGRRHGGDVVAGASAQSPSTDTLSLLSDGRIARDPKGRPLLRAGGHGSLLANLAMTPGRVVLVKNIDNIQPDERRSFVVPWRRRLAALALALRAAADRFLSTGDASSLVALGRRLGLPLAERSDRLRDQVDRPLRVAGMVPNSGEPGGGPFWVRKSGDPRLEIVEQSEVSPGQRAMLDSSTHFNPVEMACCFRGGDGASWELDRFVDPSRAFLSTKPTASGEVRVLERPGLWNGSMSGWWTVFLEIPPDTFLPAKTVHDLAHPWRVG